ncbi:endonuclease V [Tanacetum coccineum]
MEMEYFILEACVTVKLIVNRLHYIVCYSDLLIAKLVFGVTLNLWKIRVPLILNCFGSACHLGVLANLPTIGIGKNLHHVDGLTNSKVRELMEAEENSNLDFISLIGDSGNTLGAAINSSRGSFKPIFVSVGHRVSLASAVEVVRRTCKYRVPEPIRQADIRSRDYLRKHH